MGEYADDAIDRGINDWGMGREWPRTPVIRKKAGDPCSGMIDGKSCGGVMVERMNNRTKEFFLGCSKFPKCKNSI